MNRDNIDINDDFFERLRDVPHIKHTKAVNLMGGRSAYKKIVGVSARLLPDNVARLNEYIKTDISLYAIEIHGVKGVLRSIGADRLADAAFELEKLSKAGDIEACVTRHIGFITDMEAFLKQLSEVSGRPQKVNAKVADKDELKKTLPILKEAADCFDAARAHDILHSLGDMTFGEELDALVNDLNGAFERFDFDKAAEILNKIGD